MNCRRARRLMSLERDGRLDESDRRALAGHLGQCAVCREAKASLGAAAEAWKAAQDRAEIPDPAVEWQHIRRAIRRAGAAARSGEARRQREWSWWRAFSAVGGAVAAAALVLVLWRFRGPEPGAPQPGPAALGADEAVHVEFVEFAEGAENQTVYVDAETGFVVVWAEVSPMVAGS